MLASRGGVQPPTPQHAGPKGPRLQTSSQVESPCFSGSRLPCKPIFRLRCPILEQRSRPSSACAQNGSFPWPGGELLQIWAVRERLCLYPYSGGISVDANCGPLVSQEEQQVGLCSLFPQTSRPAPLCIHNRVSMYACR